jgi:cleavage and polyadenylation specificity factor subunit 1
MYEGVRQFRHFVEGRDFTLYTDHKPLQFAFTRKSCNKDSPRQVRQLDFIGQFTTDIRYIKGECNVVADALSRLEIDLIDIEKNISMEDIAKEQENDPTLKKLLNDKTHSLKLMKSFFQGLQIVFDCQDNNMRPYIPETLQRRFFDQIHNMNHPGINTTIKNVSRRGVWLNMRSNITNWTKACMSCQRSKVTKHNKTPIQKINVPAAKFSEISIDIVGPLEESDNMRYLLTIMDRFSRWCEAIPIADITAQTVIKQLFDQWISRYGLPKTILSDQGRQFQSQEFKTFCDRMGIKHVVTTAYHPQTNGLIENFHRTLKTAFKCHYPIAWTKSLSTILLGIRSSIPKDFEFSVSEVMFGQAMRLPADLIQDNNEADVQPFSYTKDLIHCMKEIRPRQINHHHRENIFIHKDMSSTTHCFVRNDMVRKPLTHNYKGPFKICSRNEKTATLDIDGEMKVISLDRLKPAYFNQEDLPDEKEKIPYYQTRSGRRIYKPGIDY